MVGREPRGIIVRYGNKPTAPNGTLDTVLHNDLHRAGCYIKSFKRWDKDAGRSCPRGGENMGCGCEWCSYVAWPKRCREAGIAGRTAEDIIRSDPSVRPTMMQQAVRERDGCGRMDNRHTQPPHRVPKRK